MIDALLFWLAKHVADALVALCLLLAAFVLLAVFTPPPDGP